jgi:hypothetical protein
MKTEETVVPHHIGLSKQGVPTDFQVWYLSEHMLKSSQAMSRVTLSFYIDTANLPIRFYHIYMP